MSAVVPKYLITCRLKLVICDYFFILVCMIWYLTLLSYYKMPGPFLKGQRSSFSPLILSEKTRLGKALS